MNRSIISYRTWNPDLAALVLRLVFGGLFIWHGYTKLSAYDQFLPMMQDIIGIGSKLSFDLVIFAEFFCGIFVALGFFTRLSVIPTFIAMFVAYFIAHKNDGFQMKELAFLFMVLCVVVFILGSGFYSVDRLIQGRKKG